MPRCRLLLATVALFSTLALATPAAAQDDAFRWSGALAAGKLLEIKNLNGAIHAEAADGDQLQIVAEKEGRDAAKVTIEVVEHADGITVCSVYPDRDGRPNVCAAGDDAHLSNDGDTKAKVTFRLRVPAGVRLDARTMNGDIEATGITAELHATTMNGEIEAATTSWASLQTMNGDIDVRMESTDWEGSLEIETMNGGIDVVLPENAATDIEATTMNGKVSSDWSLNYRDERRRNHADGRIGDGGRKLSLETMNGSIQIRRAG